MLAQATRRGPRPLLQEPQLSTPKRDGPAGEIFPYYAGYAAVFVEDVLDALGAGRGSFVLDPWNGAGTTTTTAAARGCRTAGFDLNPALVLVSKARSSRTPSLVRVDSTVKALRAAASPVWRRKHYVDDPLMHWFSRRSAHQVRSLERAIQLVLLHRAQPRPLFLAASLRDVSGLAAITYVALFRTIRRFLPKFKTSNPTWFKTAEYGQQKVRIARETLFQTFREEMLAVRAVLAARAKKPRSAGRLDTGDSRKLAVRWHSVDVVISSPPYCTRIDYAVATRPELAVLGCDCEEQLVALRLRLFGGPLTKSIDPVPAIGWGVTCREFLRKVTRHKSKASSTYYLHYFTNYFEALYASLKELNRVVRKSGNIVLVVQDSFYKELRNDLPRIVTEMAASMRWKSVRQVDFDVRGTLAGIHRYGGRYRVDANATESVVFLQRART